MPISPQDWAALKPHIAELCQVEVEAAFTSALMVNAEILRLMVQGRPATPEDITGLLLKLDYAAADVRERSPTIAHFISLTSMQLRGAFQLGPETRN